MKEIKTDYDAALLREKEVSRRVGIPSETLRYLRGKGQGPKFVKLNRSVYYPADEVEKWLTELRTQMNTGDAA